MKRVIAILVLLVTVGCADNKHLNVPDKGITEFETYGFLNEGVLKDPCVNYSLSTGNVIWGIILVETVFMPVYFFGFSLYEPISVKQECLGGE